MQRNISRNKSSQVHCVYTLVFLSALSLVRFSGAAEPLPTDSTTTRTGPLNLFDSRSSYGVGVFPEPFLVDDSDLETNELRLDWVHIASKGARDNTVTAEVERGFGMLTVEVEAHYDYNTSSEFDPALGKSVHTVAQGVENVDLGARYPIYEFVSDSGAFDTTFGVGVEVGVPTNTPLSKNTEFVPKVFNDTRLGEHVTIQTIVGYSILYGSGNDGGSNTFEYGLDLGYTIDRQQLPLPGIESLIPVFELSGETALNHDDSGHNSLLGNAAVRVNLRAIGAFQPRLGVGYVFPIDQGARDDFRWGIVTSLVFEF